VASINLISGFFFVLYLNSRGSRNAICRSSSRSANATSSAILRKGKEAPQKVAEQVRSAGIAGPSWSAIRQSAGRHQRLSIVCRSLALIAVLLFFNFCSMVDNPAGHDVIPMHLRRRARGV